MIKCGGELLEREESGGERSCRLGSARADPSDGLFSVKGFAGRLSTAVTKQSKAEEASSPSFCRLKTLRIRSRENCTNSHDRANQKQEKN